MCACAQRQHTAEVLHCHRNGHGGRKDRRSRLGNGSRAHCPRGATPLHDTTSFQHPPSPPPPPHVVALHAPPQRVRTAILVRCPWSQQPACALAGWLRGTLHTQDARLYGWTTEQINHAAQASRRDRKTPDTQRGRRGVHDGEGNSQPHKTAHAPNGSVSASNAREPSGESRAMVAPSGSSTGDHTWAHHACPAQTHAWAASTQCRNRKLGHTRGGGCSNTTQCTHTHSAPHTLHPHTQCATHTAPTHTVHHT